MHVVFGKFVPQRVPDKGNIFPQGLLVVGQGQPLYLLAEWIRCARAGGRETVVAGAGRIRLHGGVGRGLAGVGGGVGPGAAFFQSLLELRARPNQGGQ